MIKPAREIAVDVAYRVTGGAFSKHMFGVLLNDCGDAGTNLRKWVDGIEGAIEGDRAAHQAVAAAKDAGKS